LRFTCDVAPLAASKKPAKPVIEKFEATATGLGVLAFDIGEFSSDQDLQELRQAYEKGGEDALRHAARTMEKGLVRFEAQAYPMRIVRAESHGGLRTFNILAVAVEGNVTLVEPFIDHDGYPFSFIQLQVDQQGKGRGEVIRFAAVVFDKQGRIEVTSMRAGKAIALTNVRLH
jgi:hypothetical protein